MKDPDDAIHAAGCSKANGVADFHYARLAGANVDGYHAPAEDIAQAG